MPRKVLKLHYEAICNNCDCSFNIEERTKELETKFWKSGHVPFSAQYSNSTIYCPKCSSFNFRLNYIYKNVYRIRCIKCGEMFDSPETYNNRCPKCEKEHLNAISQMGA